MQQEYHREHLGPLRKKLTESGIKVRLRGFRYVGLGATNRPSVWWVAIVEVEGYPKDIKLESHREEDFYNENMVAMNVRSILRLISESTESPSSGL